MRQLLRDVSLALRTLGRSLGFTLSTILILAVGLGVNATVLSWLHSIILNPLPGVYQPSQLLALVPSYGGTFSSSTLSYPDFRDLRALTSVFSGVAGSHYSSALLTLDGHSQWIYGRVVSANTFDILGVKPELGQTFTSDQDSPEGGHPVLIISHALWQRQFGASPDVIGKIVQINQKPFTIIGVASAGFHGMTGGLRDDFWAPLSMHNEVLQYGSYESRTFRWISVLVRLRPGVHLEQAQAAISTLAAQLQTSYPGSNADLTFRCFSLSNSPIGGQAEFRPVVRLLLAVGGGVFLIVFANVANLFLVRATVRGHELALRVALGASRRALFRQFIMESSLLAVAGGALGVFIARGAVHAFTLLAPTSTLPVGYEFQLDPITLGGVAALVVLAALLLACVFVLAPRGNLGQSLKEGSRSLTGGSSRSFLRNSLVTAEMTLAFVLVVGAALCVRGFGKAHGIDVGFDPHNLVSATLSLVPSGYNPETAKTFDRELRNRLAALPGVESAALVSSLPLSQDRIFTATVDVEGYSARSGEDREISFDIVSGGYFGTMRVPLLEGRDFTDADDSTRQNVAVINESMARRYWKDVDPIGRHFTMAAGVAPPAPFVVVGVVKDGKYRSLTEPGTPLAYLAYQQRPLASLSMGVVVRAARNPETLLPLVRREIHALDSTVEPLELSTLEVAIQPAFTRVRAAAIFLLVLGSAALFLASVGIYAVTAYAVTCRSNEMGIRMALGASHSAVRAIVLAEGLRLAGVGIAAGVCASLGLTHLLSSFLYGVSPRDPLVFLAVAAMLCVVALLGCYLPAVRATRVDPMVVLRSQ